MINSTIQRRARIYHHLRRIDLPHQNQRSSVDVRMRRLVQQRQRPSRMTTKNNTTGTTMATRKAMTTKINMMDSRMDMVMSTDRKMGSSTMATKASRIMTRSTVRKDSRITTEEVESI